MQESTTIVAFDQHAALVMAAVLPPHTATVATQVFGGRMAARRPVR